MRCYLDLAATAEPLRSESALYEAGWIAMRDLHEPARALGIWSEERKRFPNGPLADEAHTSTIDALVALDRTQRAGAEIDAYLHHHPQGLRAAEMHFVKGTLLVQTDHSCRRAAAEFTLALRHPAPPWDARARAAFARCAHASAAR
jgi:outer membrane protein assembly factor BamD (BamD/ComL family)